MPDGNKSRSSAEPGRIDMTVPYELQYWLRALDCSNEELAQAANAVGTSVGAVRRYLDMKKPPKR